MCEVGDVFIRNNRVLSNGKQGIIIETTMIFPFTIAGNLVVGNGSQHWGGGIVVAGFESYRTTAPVTLYGNTVVGNQGGDWSEYAGGISTWGIHVRMSDCICRDNRGLKANEISIFGPGEPSYNLPGQVDVNNCNVAGGAAAVYSENGILNWGTGNIDADPLFVDPGHWDDNGTPADTSDDTFVPGDYHLLPGSPCIDAGTSNVDNPDTPEVETLTATDIAGSPRVIDGNSDGSPVVDIGAYEYLPGDMNYDGKVNILDLIFIRNNLGRDPAASPAARRADVNNDSRVDILDLLAARNGLGR